jgi:hypothetical protein
MIREATQNDVIPLFTPIITESGQAVNEVPIPKGTIIHASIVGYNVSVSLTSRFDDPSLTHPCSAETKMYGARMRLNINQRDG